MEGHTTTLTPAQKITIARKAIAGQDQRGAISAIAAEHGVSRQTVYTVMHRAVQAIEASFAQASKARRRLMTKLDVDAEHVTRVVLALRTVGHNSIPDIVELGCGEGRQVGPEPCSDWLDMLYIGPAGVTLH